MAFGRVGHFVKDVGGAIETVNKAAVYAVNPAHADDIVKGAATVGQTVAEHPGIIKDVGVSMLKEELKPKNLLINAALIGATVATGGAAAPAAFAARTAWAARAAKTGVTAARAAEGVEAGIEAGKVARTAKRAMEVGRAAQKAIEGGKDAGRVGRAVEEINDVRRTLSPIAQRTHAFRTAMGERALAAGVEEGATAGPVRQVAANLIQGTGGIGKTTRMAGQTENAYQMQQQARYVRTARSSVSKAKAAPAVASALADPEGYAMRKAMGGVKMGDTGEYQTTAGGQTVVPQVSANGVPVFDNATERNVLRAGQKMQNFGAGVAASNSLGGPNALWKGPNREALGGMPTSYDWRKFEQRGVNQVKRSDAFVEGGMGGPILAPLSQPGEPSPAIKPIGPAKPAPMAMKAAASPLYSSGSETSTMPGPRFMTKPGTNNRGGKPDTSEFYGSGVVSGEDTNTTMTGSTPAWNAKMEGSMAFPDLEQPKSSGRKGGIGQYGLDRFHSQIETPTPVDAAPTSPAVAPLKKKLQTVGG